MPDWRGRLAGVNDGGTPADLLVSRPRRPREWQAYGVGYNSMTRRDRRLLRPPRFHGHCRRGAIGSRSRATRAVASHAAPSSTRSRHWTTEHDAALCWPAAKLWSIDPQQKRVRALADAPPRRDDRLDLGPAQSWRPSSSRTNPAHANDSGYAPHARHPDGRRLILVDPEAGRTAPFPCRRNFRTACWPAANWRMAICRSSPSAAVMIRQAEAAVAARSAGPDRQAASGPLSRLQRRTAGERVWLVLVLAGPFPPLRPRSCSSCRWTSCKPAKPIRYAAAFLPQPARSLAGLVGALLIGVISAIAAYRRQRRFALPGAIGWAIFAFLLGMPGWIAYRFHRAWPVVEECPACDQPAPPTARPAPNAARPFRRRSSRGWRFLRRASSGGTAHPTDAAAAAAGRGRCCKYVCCSCCLCLRDSAPYFQSRNIRLRARS